MFLMDSRMKQVHSKVEKEFKSEFSNEKDQMDATHRYFEEPQLCIIDLVSN